MAFVYAALLFAYGSFAMIYIFTHLHRGDFIDKKDSFLLYYISLLLAALITTMGLWSYVIRAARPWPAGDGLMQDDRRPPLFLVLLIIIGILVVVVDRLPGLYFIVSQQFKDIEDGIRLFLPYHQGLPGILRYIYMH